MTKLKCAGCGKAVKSPDDGGSWMAPSDYFNVRADGQPVLKLDMGGWPFADRGRLYLTHSLDRESVITLRDKLDDWLSAEAVE